MITTTGVITTLIIIIVTAVITKLVMEAINKSNQRAEEERIRDMDFDALVDHETSSTEARFNALQERSKEEARKAAENEADLLEEAKLEGLKKTKAFDQATKAGTVVGNFRNLFNNELAVVEEAIPEEDKEEKTD